MKRSVAIHGSTPMFVRWAIQHPCPFRELFPQRLPETTFRQLRSIREISVANQDGRIRDGICFHPDAANVAVEEALGFPVDEIVDLFGGEDLIARTCGDCPAHSDRLHNPLLWAGCYGSVPSDLRFDFESLIRGCQNSLICENQIDDPESHPPFDLVRLMDRCMEEGGLRQEYADHFPDFQPAWFGLWHGSPFSCEQLHFLEQLLTLVLAKLDPFQEPANHSIPIPQTRDLVRLTHAVQASRQHQLALHVELVPQGYSDGIHWRLQPHCQNCKVTWLEKTSRCPCCGPAGKVQNEIKQKVLGLRPYLHLSRVIGVEQTHQRLHSGD